MSYRDLSYWFDSLGTEVVPRPALPGDRDFDATIIGGGFTGLWTAYYLKTLQPDLRIALLEAEVCGFGASGRNGGWCLGDLAGLPGLIAKPETREDGLRLRRAMFQTVDEVGDVSRAESIDCHYAKGGSLSVATIPFHVDQLKERLKFLHGLGFDEDDYRWIEPSDARERIGTSTNYGASFGAHCAAIHPARLARGLADVVERMGVKIYEQTPALAFRQGQVETARGQVKSGIILRATEAYTPTLKGLGRRLLPLYSMMVATEPLDANLWDAIGLRKRETFGDPRRMVIYGQRTADDRLAFGGRAGYFFGSKIKRRIEEIGEFKAVEAALFSLFPALEPDQITHRWGGPMGVPRNWQPSVHFDPATGMGHAGGYVGEGVAATNLAGRTLADLVLGRKSAFAELPWVRPEGRDWEIEPLRFVAARAVEVMGAAADRAEIRHQRPSRLWGPAFGRVIRH